jgi:carbon storage regulator
MLVLSRKVGERVVVGGGIAVTVVGVRADRVRLGFKAPAEVPILRSELSPVDAEMTELMLLLPRGQAEALEAAAQDLGLTVGQVLRHLVREFLPGRV